MPTSQRTPRTRLTDLSAGYGGRTVLHRITAEIPQLALTSLVGPNGGGKSTLLSAVAGVIKPTSGAVQHHGSGAPAFVPQRSAVSDALPLTVRQAVAMARWPGRGLFRRLTRDDHRIVDEALERLAITDLAAGQLGELSGGQRQRAFIAQGLAQQSDLLLLDEPCTGLDPETRDSIGGLLGELVAGGTTVVQATHDLDSARTSDHCLLLRDGFLEGAGAPARVLGPALW